MDDVLILSLGDVLEPADQIDVDVEPVILEVLAIRLDHHRDAIQFSLKADIGEAVRLLLPAHLLTDGYRPRRTAFQLVNHGSVVVAVTAILHEPNSANDEIRHLTLPSSALGRVVVCENHTPQKGGHK